MSQNQNQVSGQNLQGSLAPLSTMTAVGFGEAYISKNGEIIFDGEEYLDTHPEAKPLEEFEQLAQLEPEADWRLVLNAPLWNITFQRQGKEKWVCIDSGIGFA